MENLHGWVSTEWDAEEAGNQNKLTAERAQALSEKG
jgi:ferrochelatase